MGRVVEVGVCAARCVGSVFVGGQGQRLEWGTCSDEWHVLVALLLVRMCILICCAVFVGGCDQS